MRYSIWTAITLLGFVISMSASAAVYSVMPWVEIVSDTIVHHTTSGSQLGAPESQFDAWGLTMDRNVSSCYDANRQLPPGLRPGGGYYATSSLSLLTFTANIPEYTNFICGFANAHCNTSSIWVHPIGADEVTWLAAGWSTFSTWEFSPE